MAYKLVITEHADELLDKLVYHLIYRLKFGVSFMGTVLNSYYGTDQMGDIKG